MMPLLPEDFEFERWRGRSVVKLDRPCFVTGGRCEPVEFAWRYSGGGSRIARQNPATRGKTGIEVLEVRYSCGRVASGPAGFEAVR
jgi:hypothetical protein